MSTKDEFLTIRLSVVLKKQIQKEAKKQHRTMSNLIAMELDKLFTCGKDTEIASVK